MNRPANPNETTLSICLIGGAVGLASAAIFGILTLVDDVNRTAFYIGGALGVLAVFMLMLSVYFGGRGITRDSPPGSKNPFNRQAQAGIAGLSFLIITGLIFVLFPSEEQTELEKKVNELILAVEIIQSRLDNTTD